MLPPDSLATLLSLFRGCFTRPTFATFCSLCGGFLARVGEHTVTGMLLAARLERTWHHSRAHDFFARARWSADELGLALLDFLVTRFVAAGAPLVLAVDDTVFPRCGRKVFGAHLHRQDHVPGGGKQVRYGNCWVVLGLVMRLPFGERSLCLPLLFRLWQADPARRGYGRKGNPKKRKRDRAYPSQSELARALVELVHARHPERAIELLGDGAYATKAMRGLPAGVSMITRLKSSATLYDFPSPREPGQRGRRRLKGARLKQTLRVRPIFLQNDDRIEALVGVVGLALLVFGLIEAELRDRLGDEELPGLLPEGRSGPPTGRNILAAFQGLGLTYTANGIVLDRLTPTQRRVLELLEIEVPWPEQESLAA